MLLEHTGGNLPLWLAPDQIVVLPISEKYTDYADKVKDLLEAEGFSVKVDHRDEKIGRKIVDAEMQKVPYMLVVGEKEMAAETVSVRKHKEGDKGSKGLADFIAEFQKEVELTPA